MTGFEPIAIRTVIGYHSPHSYSDLVINHSTTLTTAKKNFNEYGVYFTSLIIVTFTLSYYENHLHYLVAF